MLGGIVLSRISIAIAAALALLAVTAGAADATATANSSKWYTGTSESSVSLLSGSRPVTTEVGFNPEVGTSIKFSTIIFGVEVQLRANVLTCLECRITNETSSGNAGIKGKLVFSHMYFVAPESCKVKEEKSTSRALLFEANYVEGSKWLMKIGPETGPGDFEIVTESAKGAGSCGLANIKIIGSEFVGFERKQGSFATSQPFNFSTATTVAAGSRWEVVGEPELNITGTAILKSGGIFFGAK